MNPKQPLTPKDFLALEDAIKIANDKYDGHYTIYSFTTNYRFYFGTYSESLFVHDSDESPAKKFVAATGEGYSLSAAIGNSIEKQAVT